MSIRLIAGLVLAACALPAFAQSTVYRCGDTYSQQPCPNGKAITAPAEPSAKDQQLAREAAQRDAKTADAMEKARLKEEAKAPAAYIPPPKPEKPVVEDKPVVSKAYLTGKPGEKKAKKAAKKKKKESRQRVSRLGAQRPAPPDA